MNTRQIRLLQESYAPLLPQADAMAALFYARLFEIDPSLRALFKNDMTEQRRKLIDMLTFVVDNLMWLDKLIPVVQALGARHAGYGVRAEHYQTVGAALLWTLEQGLGSAFTPEVRNAWSNLYTLLATTMQEAAAELVMA